MSKKVAVNKTPLEAQTIKKVKKHNFGFLFGLFIIMIFGAVIYFLPDIYTIYEDYTKTGVISLPKGNKTNNTNTNTNTSTNTTTTDEPKEETNYLTLNTDNKVSFSDVVFDSIAYADNTINITITPAKGSIVRLANLDYYLKAYNADKQLVKTYFFTQTVLNKSSVSIKDVDNAYYYEIVAMKDSDYPYFILDVDEEDKSKLTCTKDNDTVQYTFTNEVLTHIKETITIKNPTEEIKNSYSALKDSYDNYNGVSVTITEGLNYKFIVNIDMTLYNSAIKPYYFNKDAYARAIKYKIETMDFTCR